MRLTIRDQSTAEDRRLQSKACLLYGASVIAITNRYAMCGLCLATVLSLIASPIDDAASAETYGNFHTLGIVLDVPNGFTPARVSQVKLYMLRGTKARRLLDPVQVHDFTFYAVSVFDLKPDTKYSFRAEFFNARGEMIHKEEFTGQTRPEPGEPPAALKEIHVATSGDDANPGTAARPKKTLAAALQVANRAGTHVVVHEGVYYEGDLPAAGKGTAAAPIVVRGAKGETAIIDGSDQTCLAADWKDLGGGYFSTSFKGKSWVVCA
jgi:hypothetical protein